MEKVEKVNEARYSLWVVNFHVSCVCCRKFLLCLYISYRIYFSHRRRQISYGLSLFQLVITYVETIITYFSTYCVCILTLCLNLEFNEKNTLSKTRCLLISEN